MDEAETFRNFYYHEYRVTRIVRILLPLTVKHYISTKRMHSAKRKKEKKT